LINHALGEKFTLKVFSRRSWNICEVKEITFWDIPALKYSFYSILMCLNCRARNEELGEGFHYPKGFF